MVRGNVWSISRSRLSIRSAFDVTRDAHIERLLNRALELIRQARGDEAVPLLREVQRMVKETVH
jgi:hypothetical protein